MNVEPPKSASVEIVDEAFTPERPFSPKRSRSIGLILAGLLLCGLGLPLARFGRNQAMGLGLA
jgi:uncharacterized protein involved in exopolysaccharide biosynthesis